MKGKEENGKGKKGQGKGKERKESNISEKEKERKGRKGKERKKGKLEKPIEKLFPTKQCDLTALILGEVVRRVSSNVLHTTLRILLRSGPSSL